MHPGLSQFWSSMQVWTAQFQRCSTLMPWQFYIDHMLIACNKIFQIEIRPFLAAICKIKWKFKSYYVNFQFKRSTDSLTEIRSWLDDVIRSRLFQAISTWNNAWCWVRCSSITEFSLVWSIFNNLKSCKLMIRCKIHKASEDECDTTEGLPVGIAIPSCQWTV